MLMTANMIVWLADGSNNLSADIRFPWNDRCRYRPRIRQSGRQHGVRGICRICLRSPSPGKIQLIKALSYIPSRSVACHFR